MRQNDVIPEICCLRTHCLKTHSIYTERIMRRGSYRGEGKSSLVPGLARGLVL
jgi:hypothetical protein